MSWQAYADQITNQGIANAALYGWEGGAEWAKSANNAGTAAEAAKMIAHMKSNATGRVTYAGKDFITLRNTGEVLYGKLGAEGITAAKTGQCLVVGMYDQNSQPGQCNNAVENLAQYLVDNGY